MNQLKYVRYSRKSSEAREKQVASIGDQNAECEKTRLQQDLNVVIRLEEAKSSFKPGIREKFRLMLEKINTGEVNAILTWKPDRLCRNPEEGGKLLQLLQDGVLKEIRTAMGDVYTQDSDHLVLQIHFGMANQYSRNLSQNVKRGNKYKCERGEYPREAPVGFQGFGERGKRNIKPHPFEAPILKEMFNLASDGQHSLGYLADYIDSKGLRTRRGKKISKSHLYSILTSPIYYGQFYYNGELFKGDYEPLISKVLFDKIQDALHNRSKPKINSFGHWSNGLLSCPDCGCAVTTTVKEKFYKRTERNASYTFHHCTHRKGNCTQQPISGSDLKEQLIDSVSRIVIDKEVWELGIKLLKQKHGEESKKNLDQLTHLQNKYNSFQDRLNRLIDMRANDELTKDEFLHQKETLLQEQARIKSLMNDAEDSAHNWLERTEEFLNNAFYARETMESELDKEKRDLITDVGENLILRDKKIVFSFKQPYDVLLKPEYRTNWLPG